MVSCTTFRGVRTYHCTVMCAGMITVHPDRTATWTPDGHNGPPIPITRADAASALGLELAFSAKKKAAEPEPMSPAEQEARVATLEEEDPIRADLRKDLRALGIIRAEVGYNGGGDEGNTHEPTFVTEDGTTIAVEYNLERSFDNWAWEMICGLHSGFEINEGGFGNFTWDLVTGLASLDHSEYTEATDDTFHEAI